MPSSPIHFPRLVALVFLVIPACGDADANDGDAAGEDAASDATSSPPATGAGEDADPPGTTNAGTDDGPSTNDAADTDPADSSGTGEPATTGEPEGQVIVVAVGNWGHRGMTTDGVTWDDVMNAPPPDGGDHTPDLLRGVGYGDGKFVAVGGDANGMIMTTTNGVDWDEDLFPQGDGWLGDVAYLDGIWVAVGGNGVVVRSDDGGVTWSENAQRLQWAGRTILAAEGKFLAAGDAGSLATSPDGLTWDEITDPSGIGFSIAHGQDTFVGFASQWNGAGFDTACIQSPDAQAWMPCPFGSSSFGAPAAGDGVLLVQIDGGYAVSTDGSQWDTHDADFPSSLVYGDGVWVGLSYHRRWYADSYAGPWESFENVDGFRDLVAGAIFE